MTKANRNKRKIDDGYDIKLAWDKAARNGYNRLPCGCITMWDYAPNRKPIRRIMLCEEHIDNRFMSK
jgi:hypothetical protein